MATMDIIDIYDRIQFSNGDYCKVCFCTSRERRLVTPVYFTRFLRIVNHYKSFKSGIKVCYICESQALTAMKFHRAVVLGVDLEELCQRIKIVGLRNVVMKHLNGTTPGHSKLCQRATRVQRELNRVQDSMPHSLQHTDTLVVTVDSDHPVQQILADVPLTVENIRESISNRGDNTPTLDQGPGAAGPPSKVTPDIQHNHMVVRLLDEDTNKVTEHPIVVGLDGNKYVPSLELQILPGDVFRSVPGKLLQLNNATTPERSGSRAEISTVNNHETISTSTPQNGNKKTAMVNSIKQFITTDNMNIVLNFDETDELKSKKKRLSDTSNISDTLKINSDVTDKSSAKVTSLSDSSAKQPVFSIDRVDWEDKIPMDIISFMDATDPNPKHRMMQPTTLKPPPLVLAAPALVLAVPASVVAAPPSGGIGIISNVRTVKEDDDVQIQSTVECIDLC